MADPSRRRVNYTQLETLWEFLNRNRDIATGFNKTTQAREYSRRMWMEVANNLNSFGDGATKDWKGWCKYWNDYKSKIKRIAVTARSSQRQTGGGPSEIKPMTDIEKKFLLILGPDFGEGLPGMRVEPFEEEVQTAEIPSELVEESMPITPPTVQPSTEEPGPSWRVPLSQTEAPALSTATPPPATPPPPRPPSAARQTTPRRSPRHRRLRREPHMSQDATRRALIRISEERVILSRQHNVLLGTLVAELREIKEILQSR